MRTIERTAAFRRDYKRVRATPRHRDVELQFVEVVKRLVEDQALDPRHHDHPLIGNWQEHRECHIKADLLLIYKLPDADTLRLVRIGSHSELFSK